MTSSQAILQFFDPEVPTPPLRYGDSVTLIPDGINGIVVFAGGSDARPWVEVLREGAAVPPNLRDCHFRLKPRAQYGEAKNLAKVKKEGRWDGGRNLAFPEVPDGNKDLDELSMEECRRLKLDDVVLMRDVLRRLMMAADEAAGNAADFQRQQGHIVRYDDVIELEHVMTGAMITLTKNQAHERAAKKVECLDAGSEASLFVLKPAFKAYGAGETVNSGHLLLLTTHKRMAGMPYCLHMGVHHGQKIDTVLRRSLQITNPAVVDCAEVNCTTGENRPTAWRMVLFEGYESAALNASRFPDHHLRVRAEEIICFYHKEAEAYLDFHTSLGDEPVFRESTRVAVKSRKKASWMWKIESLTVNAAASPVVCGESMQYRIKHIVTNRYLAEHPDGTRLIMTNDYLTPGASFSFKSFTKEKGADLTDASIHKLGLVYIRTNTGALLHQELDSEGAGVGHSEHMRSSSIVPPGSTDIERQTLAHLKIDTLKKVGLRNSEAAASEADAVLVMNVLPSSFKSVVTVRRALHTFAGFADLLESIPIPPPSSSADSGPSRGPSSSDHRSPHVSAAASVTRVSADLVLIGDVPTRALPPRPPSHNQAVLQGETMQGDATPPARLSDEADMVLKHTDTCYQALMETLKTLVLNSTFDDDTNPMSRDGPPNRLMQKLLRELQAISTLMRMVQLPFQRGLTSAWMGSGERRFQQLVDVISLAYRLLKQICKENERNALELHQYTPTIRDHLGKGMSCTITLKEIYVGKRKLLAMVRPDLVNQFMDLLHSIKDPRYVDFLCAVCTTDGAPVVALQQMIIDGLVHNAELLPVCRVTNFKQGVRLGIHVPGTKDESGRDLYLDVADFGDHRKVKSRDMASHILTAPFGELTQTESTLRYFVRCINLYANVCLGRNQKALSFLLKNSSMPFQYDTILSLLREQTLPALIRARLTSLMIRLYVDRSPQSSAPQILYTRIWSKVKPAGGEHWGALRRNIGHPSSSSATYDTPVCITGFTDLCEFVLSALPLLGGAKGKDGEKSLNFSPTYGQIELVSAQVELCDLMLDFGFFTKNRDSVDCDFSDIQHLFEAVFAMVDTRGFPAKRSSKREALMLLSLRSSALKLLLRLLNLRANYRVSVCLDTWEQIFEQKQGKEGGTHFLQMGSFPSTMANLSRTESKREDESSALNTIFAPNKAFFESCIARCFKQDIISSGVIKSDTYAAGNFTGDPLVEAMLSLTSFQNNDLTAQACALMLRHMSQRSRVMNDLQMVQVLVFPAAVKVYDETEFAIKRLISLRKHISRDEPAAYEEATSLLKRLTGYVTVSPQFTAEFVEKHQRIMLNRELDEPVVDMLQLNLERDTSRRDALTDQGERDADPPVIPARRDLFQVCYDFLKMLCKGNPQAQKRLFPLIEIFSEHVGIEKLNVADTICEIVRDNARLISQVPEALMRHFMTAIHTWGRKARWLRFFEVFLEIGGIPFRRNQDLILRLVMEDWDALLDLSCDYSQPNQDLPQSDPRQGATLLQLIQNGEHRMEVRSLVKYHFSSINLLALCAAGKNAMNKARILQHVKFDQVTSRLLWTGRRPDGTVETEVDVDGVHYVRLAWTKMMHHVFLASLDTQSVVQVQEGMRVWVDDSPAIDSERYPGMEGVCLMQEFLRDLASLTFRLKALTKPPPGGIFTGVKDAWGHDVGCHIQYALLVVQSLHKVFSRTDMYPVNGNEDQQALATLLRGAIFDLFRQMRRLKCVTATDALTFADLLSAMHHRYVAPSDSETAMPPPLISMERAMSFEEPVGSTAEAPTTGRNDASRTPSTTSAPRNAPPPVPHESPRLRGRPASVQHSDSSTGNGNRRVPSREKSLSRTGSIRPTFVFDAAKALGMGDDKKEQPRETVPQTKETRFHEGWKNFKVHFAHNLELEMDESDSTKMMNASIFDMARMLGDRKTILNSNYVILKEFMQLVCDEHCDRLVQLNGLKVVRAILYLQPDSPGSTLQTQEREYERLLENDPPSAVEAESFNFIVLQGKLAKLGCVDLVVACMSSDNKDIILAALMLGVTLLEGGCTVAQDMLAGILSQSASQRFFRQIEQVLADSVATLKAQKRRIKQYWAERTAKEAAGLVMEDVVAPSLGSNLRSITELIKFMRRMCMGQHVQLQNILRNQKLNKVSINFLEEIVKYLVALEPELMEAIQVGDLVVVEGAIRGFLMLGEAMRGPNHANQDSVAHAGLIDLGDRIFGKVYFEEPPNPSSKKMNLKTPSSRKMSIKVEEPENRNGLVSLDFKARNRLRSRLKDAVTTALLSFLEGVESTSIPDKMLTTVQWSAISTQMSKCHLAMMRGSEILDYSQLRDEGIQYYFLMKYLLAYDERGEFIEPCLVRHKKAAHFFEVRTGFVEIVRQTRLERVFFVLPESCIPGGALDKPFAAMYECNDLFDPDQKNQQYLANMIRLIDREQHQSRVRASILAFSVTKWDMICEISFRLAIAVHSILVLGSYVPFWRREPYTAHLAQAEERTKNDIWFHETARPGFHLCAIILMIMLFVVNAIRAFAFSWAELPNIIRVGLENAHGSPSAGRDDDLDEERLADAGEGLDHEEENIFAPTKKGHVEAVEGDEDEDEALPVAASPRNDEAKDVSGQTVMFERSLSLASVAVSEGGPDRQSKSKKSSPHRLNPETLTQLRRNLRIVKICLSSGWCWYEGLLLVSATVAIILQEPTFTVGPLFDMCFWAGSKTVIDAVRFNAGKMIQTFLLGLLVMYVWSIMGIWWLSDFHSEDNCNNMLQCFFSYFYFAMRGEGLADVMQDPIFAQNIIDFTVAEGTMLLRTIWDMTFQFLFLYVLIAIITGIVIDAFGGLRDKKDEAEENIKARCFVCNLDRFRLDQNGIGFDRHVHIEHNPRYYFFFLLHVKQRPRAKLTGQEAYVLSKVWPADGSGSSYAWFPRMQTHTMDDTEEAEDNVVERRVEALEHRVAHGFARLEELLLTQTQGGGFPSYKPAEGGVRGGEVRDTPRSADSFGQIAEGFGQIAESFGGHRLPPIDEPRDTSGRGQSLPAGAAAGAGEGGGGFDSLRRADTGGGALGREQQWGSERWVVEPGAAAAGAASSPLPPRMQRGTLPVPPVGTLPVPPVVTRHPVERSTAGEREDDPNQ